jgi:hypothetical protein
MTTKLVVHRISGYKFEEAYRELEEYIHDLSCMAEIATESRDDDDGELARFINRQLSNMAIALRRHYDDFWSKERLATS